MGIEEVIVTWVLQWDTVVQVGDMVTEYHVVSVH